MVMDTGGLGRKIAEELKVRAALPIKAAEKTRKLEYIELVNDALRTGRLLARQGSQFASDCLLVEWDATRTRGEARVISDRFHSDIADAVLYAFRESLHWQHVAPAPPPSEQQAERERHRAHLERMRMQDLEDSRDPSRYEFTDDPLAGRY
jgi:hypothetical protein